MPDGIDKLMSELSLPRVTPDPYTAAIGAVKSRYPLLADIPFAVTTGKGPYFSETYLPWDEHNPKRGKLNIELRQSAGQTGRSLEDTIATEAFHLLGAQQPNGSPYNPQWWALKQQLRQQLTPGELARARQRWQEEQRGGEYRSFDQFMNRSFLDMLVRGYLSPESQGREWVERMKNPRGWTEQQRAIFKQMQALLMQSAQR